MDVNSIVRARGEEFQRTMGEQLVSSGRQLSNWLVLGNAAALAYTLSASSNLAAAPTLPVKWVYALFLIGLAASFASMMLTTMTLGKVLQEIGAINARLLNNHHREHLADELQKEGVKPPEVRKKMEEDDSAVFEESALIGERTKRQLLPARVLGVVSMLALGAGLAMPLFHLRG